MSGDRVEYSRNGSHFKLCPGATMSIKIDGSPELVKTLPAFGNLPILKTAVLWLLSRTKITWTQYRATGYLVDSATRFLEECADA